MGGEGGGGRWHGTEITTTETAINYYIDNLVTKSTDESESVIFGTVHNIRLLS